MPAAGIAVIGFAPHSGWAAVVALGGSRAEPRVLARSRVEMVDPGVPESKQPYHSVEGLELEEAARRVEGYGFAAESNAYAAIQALAKELAEQGYRVTAAGILESSGREGSSLTSILTSHALIHTADGNHFRTALGAAAERNGLTVSRLRARDLESEAAKVLGRSALRLRKAVAALGRQVGPPWGADQKSAALLAWLLLGRAMR
jgi:hypothetical protein